MLRNYKIGLLIAFFAGSGLAIAAPLSDFLAGKKVTASHPLRIGTTPEVVSGPIDTSLTYRVSIYPNPFNDHTTLTVNLEKGRLRNIKIYDLIGNEVADYDLENKTGILTFRINFEPYKPGIYFCSLYSQTTLIETKKIIKLP